MRRHLAVSLDHPGVSGAGLEDELAAAGAAGFEVDEGAHLGGPLVLGDEAVGSLEEGKRGKMSIYMVTRWLITEQV